MRLQMIAAAFTAVSILPRVLAAAAEPPPPIPPPADLDARVVGIVAAVSEERLTRILEKLESFGTRHTLSVTDSPTHGIGAARQWIFEEMQKYSPRLKVEFDTYQVLKQGDRMIRDTELRNVMAVLPGRSPRRLYVSGHYDSVARPPRPVESPEPVSLAPTNPADWTITDNAAPGVNDDGSGTALAMELARVFAESGVEFEATLVFMAFAGEEQGLFGSRLHAQRAAAEKWTIDAVLNNDIVGGIEGGNGVVDSGSVRVFSEGPEDSASRQLARAIRRAAERYVPGHRVRLVARQDRFARGGDHAAFNQRGFAAVRFSESAENYARQHSSQDTFAGVSPPYLARNARVNAAALATLALAPAAPVLTDEKNRALLVRQPSGYDAHLRWRPSPGAAGYRVFWREAWAADWQHERTVGNVTELLLPGFSIDDHVFGVASLGPEGDESLVTAYVITPRPDAEVKTKAAPVEKKEKKKKKK